MRVTAIFGVTLCRNNAITRNMVLSHCPCGYPRTGNWYAYSLTTVSLGITLAWLGLAIWYYFWYSLWLLPHRELA